MGMPLAAQYRRPPHTSPAARQILRTSDVVVPFGDPTVDAEYLEYMEGIFLLKNQLHTLKKSLHPTLLFSSEAAGEKTEKKVCWLTN